MKTQLFSPLKAGIISSLTIGAILLNLLTATAQTHDWAWAKSAGGTGTFDDGQGVSTDAYGNVYVTGSFQSASVVFGSDTLTNSGSVGSYDIFVVKYDAAGNVLWAKRAGGANNDVGYGISTDASGNVNVTGYFESPSLVFGSDTLTKAGSGSSSDVFVVKYSASGNALWATRAGGTGDDESHGISTDTSGNVYVTGFFRGPIVIGSDTLTNAGIEDIFVVKYSASGNVLWAKSAGGTGDDYGKSISIDASGNVYVTGFFWNSSIVFGSDTLTNAGGYDFFVVKYSVSGNVLWAKSVGGTDDDYGLNISTDAFGNVFVTGIFSSPSLVFGSYTLTNASSSDADIFFAKYSASGNVLWAKREGGTGYDRSSGISADVLGNVYVTGYYLSPSIVFGSDTLTNVGFYDIFVVKYSTSGNVLWAKGAGGTNSDYSYGISTEASGNVFVTGGFATPSMVFGSDTLTTAGGYDIFVAKLSSCATLVTVNPIACNKYISPSGNFTWNISGIYIDTIPNAAGCDSVIAINLTINNADTSVIQTGITLTSNAVPATFQWIDCNNSNAPIAGDTNQTFTATLNGNYAVIVTENGCADTSACYSITTVGINENELRSAFTIYPNPAGSSFVIRFLLPGKEKGSLRLFDVNGRLVSTLSDKIFEPGIHEISFSTENIQAGIYFLRMETTGGSANRKLIVIK